MEEKFTKTNGMAARPWIADLGVALFSLAFLVAALSYARPLQDLYTLPKRFAVGVLGVAAIAVTFGLRSFGRLELRWPLEILAALAFLGVAAVGCLRSASPAEGVDLLRDLTVGVAFFAFGWTVLSTARRRRIFVTALVLTGTVVAAVGFAQLLHLDRRESALGIPTYGLFERLPMTDRPGSVFGHVNMASEVVLIGVLAALSEVVAGLTLRRGSAVLRWLGILGASAAALFGAAFLVVGGCRAAWIGGLTGGIVLAVSTWMALPVTSRRKALRVVGVLSAVLFSLVLSADQLVRTPGRGGGAAVRPSERVRDLFSLEDGTEHERLVLWKNTVAMAMTRPLLGVGAGNWKIEYPRFGRAEATLERDRFNLRRQPEAAHMDFLQLLAETGVLGAAAMTLFFGAAFLRGFRGGRSHAEGCPAGETPPRGAERGEHGLPVDDASPAGAPPRLVGLDDGDRRSRGACLAVVAGVVGTSVAAYAFQNPVPAAAAFTLLGAAGAGSSRATLRAGRRATAVLAVVVVLIAVVVGFSLHARFVANREHFAAQNLHLSAGIAVQDRGPVGASPRELLVAARDGFDRAITREPGNFRYQAHRAKVLWDLGLGDDAALGFARTLALHPNFVNAMLLRSTLLLRRVDESGRRPFAEAYELLTRAIKILPEESDLRLALADLLHRRARETRDALAEAEAAAQYRLAGSFREYAPEARIGLAELLLETGGPLAEVASSLAKAEENAALEPQRLAEIARLYAHPRLALVSGDLFGPAGRKTIAVWERVLGLTARRHPEALLEVRAQELNREVAGGRPVEPAYAEALLLFVDDLLSGDPRNLVARYYRALLLERLQRHEEALREWSLLVRAGRELGVPGSRLREIVDRALLAASRNGTRAEERQAPEGDRK